MNFKYCLSILLVVSMVCFFILQSPPVAALSEESAPVDVALEVMTDPIGLEIWEVSGISGTAGEFLGLFEGANFGTIDLKDYEERARRSPTWSDSDGDSWDIYYPVKPYPGGIDPSEGFEGGGYGHIRSYKSTSPVANALRALVWRYVAADGERLDLYIKATRPLTVTLPSSYAGEQLPFAEYDEIISRFGYARIRAPIAGSDMHPDPDYPHPSEGSGYRLPNPFGWASSGTIYEIPGPRVGTDGLGIPLAYMVYGGECFFESAFYSPPLGSSMPPDTIGAATDFLLQITIPKYNSLYRPFPVGPDGFTYESSVIFTMVTTEY